VEWESPATRLLQYSKIADVTWTMVAVAVKSRQIQEKCKGRLNKTWWLI
jgi:hypothetical protein